MNAKNWVAAAIAAIERRARLNGAGSPFDGHPVASAAYPTGRRGRISDGWAADAAAAIERRRRLNGEGSPLEGHPVASAAYPTGRRLNGEG